MGHCGARVCAIPTVRMFPYYFRLVLCPGYMHRTTDNNDCHDRQRPLEDSRFYLFIFFNADKSALRAADRSDQFSMVRLFVL